MLDCAIASDCPVPGGRMVLRLADEVSDGAPAAFSPPLEQAAAACRDLLELLAGVTDGRPGQGGIIRWRRCWRWLPQRWWSGPTFTAIAGWAADVL